MAGNQNEIVSFIARHKSANQQTVTLALGTKPSAAIDIGDELIAGLPASSSTWFLTVQRSSADAEPPLKVILEFIENKSDKISELIQLGWTAYVELEVEHQDMSGDIMLIGSELQLLGSLNIGLRLVVV